MINILYIDADESLLHLCKKYLERSSDLHVDTVSSVLEAEKMLSKQRYDAIISDLYLSWMSGLEFLKKLRLKNDRIPFVLFTGRVQEDTVIDALNSDVDSFLLKGNNPISKFSDLEQMVRHAVHNRWKEEATSLKTKAFDRALIANFMVDTQDRVLEFNSEAMRIWKISERSLLMGLDVKELLEHSEIFDVIKASIDILGRWEGDFTARRQDGSTFTAYAHVNSVLDDTGKLTGYHVALTDVTNKKNGEEALKKNEENLRLIADSSSDWIALLDRTHVVGYSSRAIKDMTCHCPEEITGLGISTLVHKDDVTKLTNYLKALQLNGSPKPLELRLVKKDGKALKVEMTGRTVKDTDGGFLRTLLITQDISSRPKAAAASPAVKTKAADVNVVATPEDLDRLMDVKGHLEVVKERTTDPWLMDRYTLMDTLLDAVIDNATSIMEFQQIGSREAEWQSIHDLLRDIVTRVDPEDVHVQVLAKRLEVLADPMLDRVFFSLIDNTMKHGGKAHKIWVTYEIDGDDARIIYEDNGIGIPEERKSCLFERRSGKHGLPLASAILGATDIRITENGIPGKGVRFEIRVPRKCFRLRE
ncbi:MAG: PAS domain S-box protein [Euryarchaeota archaeon]|nr:PAS domain S-box protein [Euryarchaeota archaeon]